MERMVCRSRDESRLVFDPKLPDRVEAVDEYNTLEMKEKGYCQHSLIPWDQPQDNLVTHPHLENRAVFLRPSPCHPGMIYTQL